MRKRKGKGCAREDAHGLGVLARRLPKDSPSGQLWASVTLRGCVARVPLTWVPAWQALKRRKRRGSTRMKPQMNEGRGTGECFFKKVRTLSRHARSISQTFTFPPSHPLTTSVSETWKSKEKYLNQCVGGASPNAILWTKVNIKKSTVIVVKTKSTLLNWKNYSSIAYINCLYHVSMTKRPPALASSKVPHWKKTFSKV